MRKKIKCYKCQYPFFDREDPTDEGKVHKQLCWNCRFVWQMIEATLIAVNRMYTFSDKPLNREVKIHLDDVHIKRVIKKDGR